MKYLIQAGWLLLCLNFSGGCSLTSVWENDRKTSTKPEPLVDLFAADKIELIEEIWRQKESIDTLQGEKETLVQQNLKLSNEVRSHQIQERQNEREKQEALAQAKMAIAIPEESSGRYSEYDYHNMGIRAFTEGKYNTALANFRKSLALNPQFFEAHTNIGVVFITLGQPEQARLHLMKALDIQPDFKHAQFYLDQVEKLLDLKY